MITLPENLRIRDYDKSQYVIEKGHISNKGDLKWVILAYCGTINGLQKRSRELVANEASSMASREAQLNYDNGDYSESISLLKPKTGK